MGFEPNTSRLGDLRSNPLALLWESNKKPYVLLNAVDASGQVLGDLARVDRLDARLLQRLRVSDEVFVPVQVTAVLETSRPREDARDGVCARGVALLVLPVVARHGAVGRLGFNRPAVGTHENARHQAEGTVTCWMWERI